MRSAILSILAPMALFHVDLTESAHAATDFSGTWIRTQVQRHGRPTPPSDAKAPIFKLVIEPQQSLLHVSHTLEGMEPKVFVFDLTGKETVKTTENRRLVSTAVWEGTKLVITSTVTVKAGDGEKTGVVKQVWTLSPDGKTLTIGEFDDQQVLRKFEVYVKQ